MVKDAYHHGDLANALVEAALEAVEQAGPAAVSLRDLAKRLGVSRSAPYRHFPDRDDLLAAVAARGFEDLNASYAAALEDPAEGKAALRRAGQVYFDFARQRPGLFRLMFESDFLSRERPPQVLIGPADKAYRLLWEAVRRAYPGAGEAEIKARTVISWSMVFGFITLDRAGRFKDFMIEPLSHEEVVEAVLSASSGLEPF